MASRAPAMFAGLSAPTASWQRATLTRLGGAGAVRSGAGTRAAGMRPGRASGEGEAAAGTTEPRRGARSVLCRRVAILSRRLVTDTCDSARGRGGRVSRRDETVSDAVSRGVVARAHASWTGTTFRGTRVAPRTIRRCVTASRPMEAANAAAANVWLIVPSNQRRAPARRRYARATRAELIVSLSCESLGSSSERGAVRL